MNSVETFICRFDLLKQHQHDLDFTEIFSELREFLTCFHHVICSRRRTSFICRRNNLCSEFLVEFLFTLNCFTKPTQILNFRRLSSIVITPLTLSAEVSLAFWFHVIFVKWEWILTVFGSRKAEISWYKSLLSWVFWKEEPTWKNFKTLPDATCVPYRLTKPLYYFLTERHTLVTLQSHMQYWPQKLNTNMVIDHCTLNI